MVLRSLQSSAADSRSCAAPPAPQTHTTSELQHEELPERTFAGIERWLLALSWAIGLFLGTQVRSGARRIEGKVHRIS